MKTPHEILEKYIENVLGVKVVEDEKAILAMEEYASQFKSKSFGHPSDPDTQKLSQKDCTHKRVRENISGGRFDECLDCGKIWG